MNTKFEQVAREAPVYSLDALVADFGGTLRCFCFFILGEPSGGFCFFILLVFISLASFSFFWELCLSLLSCFQSLPWVQLHDSLAPLVGCLATVSNIGKNDF